MLGLVKLPVRFIRPRFKSPRLRVFCNPPIIPPPGLSLQAPEDWTVQKFFNKIGGDTEEYSDNFESVQEVLDSKTKYLKEKGLPPRQRKYVLRINEYLRRGVLSFELLEKRTAVPKE